MVSLWVQAGGSGGGEPSASCDAARSPDKLQTSGHSFSAGQDCGDDAGMAASMKHGDHHERVLIRAVNNEVVTYRVDPRRVCGQVNPRVALMWKGHKRADCIKDLFTDVPGGLWTISGDLFPDFSDVLRCARVKNKALAVGHFGERRLRSSSSR
jgi:hypothetical protein